MGLVMPLRVDSVNERVNGRERERKKKEIDESSLTAGCAGFF